MIGLPPSKQARQISCWKEIVVPWDATRPHDRTRQRARSVIAQEHEKYRPPGPGGLADHGSCRQISVRGFFDTV
jgi:hypothetical protein